MQWNPETRYRLLLKINNATIVHKSREGLFKAVAMELHQHFNYDRLSINLYDAKTQSVSYFATADGILLKGNPSQVGRPRPSPVGNKIKTFLTKHSVLFSFVDYRLAGLKKKLRAWRTPGVVGVEEALPQPPIPGCFHKTCSPETREAWDLTFALMDHCPRRFAQLRHRRPVRRKMQSALR